MANGTPAKTYATFAPLPSAAHGGAAATPEKPHPRASAWFGSRLFLSWVSPLMAVGQQKQLDADDIWALEKQHQSKHVSDKFSRDFYTTRSILKAFMQSFGWRFTLTGVALLIGLLSSLAGPVVLNHVVSSLTSTAFSLEDVSLWVGGLFLSQVVQALVDNYIALESQLIAIELISCLKSLLYSKTMRLSAKSRMEKSTGDITNMYTSDCWAILSGAHFVHQMWMLPLQIGIVSYLLYSLLNVAAFAGIGMIIATLLLNQYMSTRMFGLQRVYRDSIDVRVKKVTEVFKAINIVKYNAWEGSMLGKIQETRDKELDNLFLFQLYTSASIVLMWGMPVFISVVTFGTYSVLLERELSPAIVFTSLALFAMIQDPLRYMTDIVMMLIQSRVALEKVSQFMDMSEIDESSVLGIHDSRADKYFSFFSFELKSIELQRVNTKAGM